MRKEIPPHECLEDCEPSSVPKSSFSHEGKPLYRRGPPGNRSASPPHCLVPQRSTSRRFPGCFPGRDIEHNMIWGRVRAPAPRVKDDSPSYMPSPTCTRGVRQLERVTAKEKIWLELLQQDPRLIFFAIVWSPRQAATFAPASPGRNYLFDRHLSAQRRRNMVQDEPWQAAGFALSFPGQEQSAFHFDVVDVRGLSLPPVDLRSPR
jgi:hypothetical protein